MPVRARAYRSQPRSRRVVAGAGDDFAGRTTVEARARRYGRRTAALRRMLFAAGLAAGLAWADGGVIDGGSAALFPYAAFFESDKPIVCMLPQGTRVEKLGEAPLIDGTGAVIVANYFIRVNVLEGDCKDRIGWVTRSHYRG